jgi:PAS domain S-box-containing protein
VDALQAVANRLGAEILRKQAEETLRGERNFTTAVLNNAGPLILVTDKEGRIVRFNKTCERLTGYSHMELKGRYLWDCLILPEEKDAFISLFPFNRDKVRDLPPNFENNWVKKDGQKRLISWSNTIMGDGKETEIHIVSIGIDITEKRKMETEAELRRRQLIQADKMASLGILVSGVAHEVNNPNNVIMMNTEILREAWHDVLPILERYMNERGDFNLAGIPYSEMYTHIPELFDGIQEGSERIRQIVMSLKDYSREDVSDITQEVNLNEAVEAALRLLSNQIKKTTQSISINYSEILPPVKGRLQHLEQVIINLIQNACQALPSRDKGISIRTFFDKKNGEVVLRIKDEGIGIAPEHMDNIFDPFFTTKRDTGGTGLGLSVCAGIVKKHNGRLEFSSKPHQGTTVCLMLPAVVE